MKKNLKGLKGLIYSFIYYYIYMLTNLIKYKIIKLSKLLKKKVKIFSHRITKFYSTLKLYYII